MAAIVHSPPTVHGVLEYWRNKNSKSQITNNKWFDKLTTLSQVEGQITMTKIRNSKPVLCFVH
jgi:hypothetical protein